MPLYTLSKQFKKELKKRCKKDTKIKDSINDALEKFLQDPVPAGLHFKPVPGSPNRHYIHIPKYHGWRITFRKIKIAEETVYEAIEFGNHDMKREGK